MVWRLLLLWMPFPPIQAAIVHQSHRMYSRLSNKTVCTVLRFGALSQTPEYSCSDTFLFYLCCFAFLWANGLCVCVFSSDGYYCEAAIKLSSDSVSILPDSTFRSILSFFLFFPCLLFFCLTNAHCRDHHYDVSENCFLTFYIPCICICIIGM